MIRDYDNADKELRTIQGEIEKEKTRLEGDLRVWQSRLQTAEKNAALSAKLMVQRVGWRVTSSRPPS